MPRFVRQRTTQAVGRQATAGQRLEVQHDTVVDSIAQIRPGESGVSEQTGVGSEPDAVDVQSVSSASA